MTDLIADICIIGAGSAGLSVAAGAAQLGARTVLIEGNRMGGDCLNTGCVPSKALLAVGHAAAAARRAARLGVRTGPVEVDFAAARAHVHATIARIAPHDSVERFARLGCTVIQATASFLDPRTVQAGDYRIHARRFVVATGSAPTVPAIPGLQSVPFLTNETIFDLDDLPPHLLVLGGGPIGCEMAQAFRRLGAAVTLVARGRILARDDTEGAALVAASLRADGIAIIEEARVDGVTTADGGPVLLLADGRRLAGSHLLVATGRTPRIAGLGLDVAGIHHERGAITVDARLRTSNRRVFAIGDVVGGPQFTHWAGYQAGIVLRNALFRLPARASSHALPWCTYTDPELAQVGQTEAMARQIHGAGVRVVRVPFSANDRAVAEDRTEGFAKAILDRRGRLLGATVVGPHAGELIQTWGMALTGGGLRALAGQIAPYPTLGESAKRAANEHFAPVLFGPLTKRLVRVLGWLG